MREEEGTKGLKLALVTEIGRCSIKKKKRIQNKKTAKKAKKKAKKTLEAKMRLYVVVCLFFIRFTIITLILASFYC